MPSLLCSRSSYLPRRGKTRQDDYSRERKFSAAAAILEKRLKSDPRNFGALMLLGICQQQLGELSKAEASFLAATKLQPGTPPLSTLLPACCSFRDGLEPALAAVSEAQRLHEPPARVHHLRGRIEEERGHFDAALDEYRGAIAADRNMVEALSGEASGSYKLQRYAEARSSAQAALRLQGDNEEAKRIWIRRTARRLRPRSRPPEPVRFTRQDSTDFKLDNFASDKKYLISTMIGGWPFSILTMTGCWISFSQMARRSHRSRKQGRDSGTGSIATLAAGASPTSPNRKVSRARASRWGLL